MFRRYFGAPEQGYYAGMREYDISSPKRFPAVSTYIFSSISDALSKAYDSARETVVEAADIVADKVSDAYDSTLETVSDAADVVSDAYSSTRNVVSETAEKISEVASDAFSATTETISTAAQTVAYAASDALDASQEYVSELGDKFTDADGSTNYWAIAGGAAIGVGAVAAIPFTGGGSLLGAATLMGSLAGGATVAAAVGAGVAGAVVGVHLGDSTAEREKGYNKGFAEGKAETVVELEKLGDKFERVRNQLKETGQFFNGVIAMHAVAIAAANCDGEISEVEKQSIDMLIFGLASDSIPPAALGKIASLYQNPPSIRDAFELAKASDVDLTAFREIINIIMESDGLAHVAKDTFMQAWNELIAA
ncbi:hypothetical protein AU074_21790 [Pseudomonas sp. ATCC PTA-122608]|uniref:hypothetical protein n=1 Tax=Pseudomonas sp. ATCC PTA-122608 TaxID=1771311 RepID=UPI00096B86EF|nr:hypothetical protein [Pseudomonas sp. ATCC PTA-122608]OLY75705.1 hypothetical protein AU074_21790 [Pseudomonas sp. ATCC PTA-122608]